MNRELKNLLLNTFKDSFINNDNTFIGYPKYNICIRLEKCKTFEDLQIKVLSYFLRPICKGDFYYNSRKPYGKRVIKAAQQFLDNINQFLGANLKHDDLYEIYGKIGNECNKELAKKFINSDFNMDILIEEKINKE